MTLFEKRAFAIVIKLRILSWDHPGFKEGPKSHSKCHYKGNARETHGGGDVKTKVEIGWTPVQIRNAKDCQCSPDVERETENKFSLRASRRSKP